MRPEHSVLGMRFEGIFFRGGEKHGSGNKTHVRAVAADLQRCAAQFRKSGHARADAHHGFAFLFDADAFAGKDGEPRERARMPKGLPPASATALEKHREKLRERARRPRSVCMTCLRWHEAEGQPRRAPYTVIINVAILFMRNIRISIYFR